MTKTTIRAKAVAAPLLLASLALVGCAATTQTSDHLGMHSSPIETSANSEFSDYDIMFAQMMIVHHQQAIDMATLAETRASDPEVKTLAAKIKAEQSPEIAQMKTWQSSANAPMEMDHDMGMDGMLDAEQIANLANSKGAAFDKLFLEAMIAHHAGAIQMAEMVISSNNAEAVALGKSIIESQTEEISFIKSLLAK